MGDGLRSSCSTETNYTVSYDNTIVGMLVSINFRKIVLVWLVLANLNSAIWNAWYHRHACIKFKNFAKLKPPAIRYYYCGLTTDDPITVA